MGVFYNPCSIVAFLNIEMEKSTSKDGPGINVQAQDVETADVDLLKKGNGVDEAFQALALHGPVELTPENNRALLRKIDWRQWLDFTSQSSCWRYFPGRNRLPKT